MKTIWPYIAAHPTTVSLVCFYIWSAFIGSLPAPQIDSGQFYRFLFTFLNTLGANLSRAYSSRLPIGAAQATGVADAQTAKGLTPDPPRAEKP
jgi:hypothetical protein